MSDPAPTADSLAAIRLPFVRQFAAGRFISVLGVQIISVAVGWELYERTHTPWALGLIGLFELLPVLVFMVSAGNASDRYPRRYVAIAAHAFLALVAGGFALCTHAHAPIPVTYALLIGVGLSRAFSAPAVANILPQILTPLQFANANAWLSSSFKLAATSGPAVGGALIALFGSATYAYLIAGACELGFVVILTTLPHRPASSRGEKKERGDIFAGFSFIRKNPVFLAAITLDLFAVLLGGAVALLPMFAKDILHVGPAELGWLRAAPSIGALLTALISTRLPPWKRPGRVLLWAVAGFGLATIVFGLSRNYYLSIAMLFLTGLFDEVSVLIRWVLEQILTPDGLRGRVTAVHFVFIGLSNELGGFESGATAALFGPVLSVVGGGIGTLLVVGATAFLWPQLTNLGPIQSLQPPIIEEIEAEAVAAP